MNVVQRCGLAKEASGAKAMAPLSKERKDDCKIECLKRVLVSAFKNLMLIKLNTTTVCVSRCKHCEDEKR